MGVVGTPVEPIFVPFPGVKRVQGGPVGTASAMATATGDSSGGSVLCSIKMERTSFGMMGIFVPTAIVVEDYTASAECVIMKYTTDNVRWSGGGPFQFLIDTARVDVINSGFVEGPLIPCSVRTDTAVDVITALWITNTNTKEYYLKVYGVVYDEQRMARAVNSLSIEGPLAGAL